MTASFRPIICATVLLMSFGTATVASDRVYVTQASAASRAVYVRQAMELPDQRAVRAAAARKQRVRQVQRQRAQQAQRTEQAQRTQAAVQSAQASDASMLELSPVNMPPLPAAHIAVD